MTILRETTNAKHRQIEKLPLIATMFEGKFDRDMYLHYLYEIKHIYNKIESLAKQNNLTEGLYDLYRYDNICRDIEELGGYADRALMPATVKYLQHLDDLNINNPKMIFAHVYVRHMGDLYGGKIMAKLVPGSGLAYHFADRPRLIKEFNEKLTMDLGDEANLAFDHFIEIFTELWDKQINIPR